MKTKILTNLQTRFNDINNRSSAYENKRLEDCFELDFVFLQSFLHNEDAFKQDAQRFRSKIDQISKKELSKSGSGTGFGQIAQKMVSVWNTIKESNDFDAFDLGKIRDQVYCSNMIGLAKEQADNYYRSLKQDIKKEKVPVVNTDLIEKFSKDCINFFIENTSHCNEAVRNTYIKDLNNHLSSLISNLMSEVSRLQNE